MTISALFLFFGVPTAFANSVSGIAPQDIYQDCINLADENPNEAFDLAQSWQSQGGGPPALHCAALSLVKLGHYGSAAEKLEALASIPGLGEDELKAEVLTQAGNSWLMADVPSRAIKTLSLALSLIGDNAAILTDRARAFGLREEWDKAEEDLNTALLIDPEYTPAYVYRASARRKLGYVSLAMEDIELAIALDASMPEAFLERGLLFLEREDPASARQDWLKAISLDPDHSYAETARSYIEALDVKTQ